MLSKKKAFLSMLLAFIYIFLTTQMHYLNIADPTLSHIRHLVKGILDFLPLIAWYWFIKISVIQPSVRKYLILGSFCMQFSMFVIYLQTIVTTENVELMALSVIGIVISYFSFPVFSLLATLCLGRPEQYRLPKRYHILTALVVVIYILSFTNSIHHLFFDFNISPTNVNRAETTLGPLCFVAIGFALGAYIWRLVELKRFMGKAGKGGVFTLIFALIMSILIYHIPYVFNGFTPDWEFVGSTQYVFFIEVLTWIVCMSTGLVPVNTSHAKIYDISSLKFEIYDLSGNPVFPKNALPLASNTFKTLVGAKTLKVSEDTVLNLAPLRKKGYVVWRKDISYINRLTAEERRLQSDLKDRESELQNELTLASEKEKLQQKKAIYARIDDALKVDISFLNEQIKKLEKSEEYDENLYRSIVQRGTYVKRKSNLLIMNETEKLVSLSELKLTMDEMLTSLYDIEADDVFLIPTTSYIATADIISCLDALFRLVSEVRLKTVHLRIFSENKESFFGLYYENESGEKASTRLKINTYEEPEEEVIV